MIKNQFKTSFITIEFEELFNGVLTDITDIFKDSMSGDKLPYISPEDIDTVFNDLIDIDNSPIQNQTDEELERIHQLEQELKSSPEPINQTNVSELLNPIDINLLNTSPEENFIGPQMQINPISQLPTLMSPLSPDSQMSRSMNTLSIEQGNGNGNSSGNFHQNQVTYNPNLVMIRSNRLELNSCLSSEPSVRSQRQRNQTFSGPFHYNEIGNNSMTSYVNTPFIEGPTFPMTTSSTNKGGHSVQPYGQRSSTCPLPEFGSTFRPEVNQSFENTLMNSTSGYSSTNYFSQNSGLTYPTQINRSISEPVLPRPITTNVFRGATNRGRPPSRPHSRRQPTPRQKQENLEIDLQSHAIRNNQLNYQIRSLLSSIQHFRQRLTELGVTPQQMDFPRSFDNFP